MRNVMAESFTIHGKDDVVILSIAHILEPISKRLDVVDVIECAIDTYNIIPEDKF